jgi:hypothetical protein
MTQTTLNKDDSDEDNAAFTEDTITSIFIINYLQALDAVETLTIFFLKQLHFLSIFNALSALK